ncbi:molybdenum cofactor biosynthesis protein MoaE [Sphingomonas baiyangensis]|uniref:Molybdopterin synthase catalytic subunit n=1 Tax=Sphingomonas baiyangensis TaxID=2572576 RepID=A0A4V5PTM6_9SPHN|nr:molybdenum cofactor biosynthesis protein MoaE [Sphingomonas baiyangensis]TKD50638.1 molybdenum cofactor biosynthesis protein MoaE [Sphingomonas baiyangensis]
MIDISVNTAAIDVAAVHALVEGNGAGAVATFVGIVRTDDGVRALTLEHYPAMTKAALHHIAADATRRFGLSAIAIHHRVGTMLPGERIVMVAAAAPHRHDALAATAQCIDLLKTEAPFWKREEHAAGARWVEARAGDDAAAAKWSDGRA